MNNSIKQSNQKIEALVIQHENRIKRFTKEERQRALDNIFGCLSTCKNVDFEDVKMEEILK